MQIPFRGLTVWVMALLLGALSVGGALWAKKRVSTTGAGMLETNPKDGLKYVWIPAGTFLMGCSPGDNECVDAEKPAHNVTISKGFWIGQTLVTVAAYKRYTAATGKPMAEEPDLMGRPLNPGWKNEKEPIVNVNWEES